MVRLFSILPTFTGTKIAGLQSEDLALLTLLAFCLARWLCSGFRFRISPGLAPLFRKYAFLLVLLFCFAVAALRMPFFPLDESSILKLPGFFSLSRYVQFAAVICGFLWLTNTLLHDRHRLEQALNLYWWTGIGSCALGVGSFFVLREFGVSFLGAYVFNESVDAPIRARGFFNEGGPFGLYVVSVLLIGLLRRHLTGKRIGVVNGLICVTAFVLSASRAGFLEAVLLTLIAILMAASFWRRVVILLVAGGGIFWAAMAMNVFVVLNSYLFAYQNLDSRLNDVAEVDQSLTLGRVAGAYIVPRMIEAHPLAGIGIGNYPLMRNDPRYRGKLPDIRYFEDLPGLGIVGDAAELGVPATVFLISLFFAPYTMCKESASIVRVCSLFQLLAHFLGVNLTFFYPWFVSACAIAASRFPAPVIKQISPLRSLMLLMTEA
jgi:hypothetical protein